MKKTISLITILLILSAALSAQTLRTGFFANNYKGSTDINPSFASDQGYLSFLTGGIYAGIDSNLGTNLLFPLDGGGYGTFLHPSVASEDAMAVFAPNNHFNFDTGVKILSSGRVRGKHAYSSFDASIRTNTQMNIPYDLFAFLKNGMDSPDTSYNLGGFNLSTGLYGQVAWGLSTQLFGISGLRGGFKLKALVGFADVGMGIDEMNIRMSRDAWEIQGSASGVFHGKGLKLGTDSETGEINGELIFDKEGLGITSVGAALDLGVSWRIPILSGLTLSASLVDFNFYNLYVGENSSQYFSSSTQTRFIGAEDFLQDGNASIGDQLSGIADDLMSILQFKEGAVPADKMPTTGALPTKIYAGARQAFLGNSMSVGVLYSGYYGSFASSHEVTFGYSLHPSRWFNLTASYSPVSSRGRSMGFLMNITPRGGFNLWIGSDFIPLYFNEKYIPELPTLSSNLVFGLSIPIGKVRPVM